MGTYYFLKNYQPYLLLFPLSSPALKLHPPSLLATQSTATHAISHDSSYPSTVASSRILRPRTTPEDLIAPTASKLLHHVTHTNKVTPKSLTEILQAQTRSLLGCASPEAYIRALHGHLDNMTVALIHCVDAVAEERRCREVLRARFRRLRLWVQKGLSSSEPSIRGTKVEFRKKSVTTSRSTDGNKHKTKSDLSSLSAAERKEKSGNAVSSSTDNPSMAVVAAEASPPSSGDVRPYSVPESEQFINPESHQRATRPQYRAPNEIIATRVVSPRSSQSLRNAAKKAYILDSYSDSQQNTAKRSKNLMLPSPSPVKCDVRPFNDIKNNDSSLASNRKQMVERMVRAATAPGKKGSNYYWSSSTIK